MPVLNVIYSTGKTKLQKKEGGDEKDVAGILRTILNSVNTDYKSDAFNFFLIGKLSILFVS